MTVIVVQQEVNASTNITGSSQDGHVVSHAPDFMPVNYGISNGKFRNPQSSSNTQKLFSYLLGVPSKKRPETFFETKISRPSVEIRATFIPSQSSQGYD